MKRRRSRYGFRIDGYMVDMSHPPPYSEKEMADIRAVLAEARKDIVLHFKSLKKETK